MTLLTFDLNLNQLRDRDDAGLFLLALLAILVFLLFGRAGFGYFVDGDSFKQLGAFDVLRRRAEKVIGNRKLEATTGDLFGMREELAANFIAVTRRTRQLLGVRSDLLCRRKVQPRRIFLIAADIFHELKRFVRHLPRFILKIRFILLML